MTDKTRVELAGRLGNNLFQIAAGYAHALRTKTKFGITQSFWKYSTFLSVPMSYIPENEGITKSEEIYKESDFHFKPIPKQARLLKGHFQSEKYFIDFEKEIRSLINIKKWSDKLPLNCVAVHVRRGDYLNLPLHHPVLPFKYYEEAFSKFGKLYQFFIFSDDLDWCGSVFCPHMTSLGYTCLPVVSEIDIKDLENMYFEYNELMLMANFSNFIIANSSYSWWGAWLSDSFAKKVVAPAKWFGPNYSHYDTTDLYPKGWIIC